MVKQERAARTRVALVRAAAKEVDLRGYERTTLARICEAADISMGALTFHFKTKRDLAQEVQVQGGELTARLVARHTGGQDSPLGAVGDIVVGLARLLEEEVLVRSAARLARELPDAALVWASSWRPQVDEFLARARQAGELRPSAQPAAVGALLASLLAGLELTIRERALAPGGGTDNAEVTSRRLWALVLEGIAAEGA